MRACLTTGRARKVTMIICSQRPSGLPTEVRSEANKYAMFRLQHPDDRKYMAAMMGSEVMTNPVGHNFWFFDPDLLDKPELLVLK